MGRNIVERRGFAKKAEANSRVNRDASALAVRTVLDDNGGASACRFETATRGRILAANGTPIKIMTSSRYFPAPEALRRYAEAIRGGRMNPGSVVEAEVTAVESYGVYLVCEGRKVLVLNGELAWLPNAGDFTAIGSRHQVRLLRFVPDTELFLASFKQVHPEQDPWRNASRFAIGSVRPATVTKLVHRGDQPTLCGRLLELEPGVAGYLPAADSGAEPSLGAVVRVRIVRVDAASQQIELAAAGE